MNRLPSPTQFRLSFPRPVIALLAGELAIVSLLCMAMSAASTDRGAYTGETVAGQPVFRLPAIEVVADRKSELAKIEREERREQQAKAKAGRPAA